MKWSNGNYHLFEPRYETGLAASMLCQKLILFDGILWITAPYENLAMYRLYQIYLGIRAVQRNWKLRNNVPRNYSMYGHTSVRLVKIYNEMI